MKENLFTQHLAKRNDDVDLRLAATLRSSLEGRVVTTLPLGASLASCRSRIFMQPSEDRHGEGRGQLGIQQRCRVPLLVRNDRPARRYSGTGVFATDGSNPDTTTVVS